MKVSLVFPPFYLESLYSLPPLGLLNLASALKLAGHQPTLHDLVLELKESKLPLNKNLYAACAERILDAKPQVVGFSAQCTTYPAMLNLARELKRRAPELFILAGGHNASFVDLQTLERFPEFDAVARSEGEITIVELLDALAAGRPIAEIPGITSRQDGRVVRAAERELVADLDSLPRLDYSLGPRLERYARAFELSRSIAILEVGRGCPHACVYCSESAMWRRRSRVFSIERLVSEMRLLRDDEGAQCFLLSYDQFTTDKDFVRGFCTAVLEAGLADCAWHCISRLDTVDSQTMALMRRSGCESMCYGIDSGSKRTLAFINKRIDENLLFTRVRETTEQGMNPTLSFILGFPEEERADIDATLSLALRCGIQGNVSPLVQLPTVLPGTELHRLYADKLVREVDTYFALGLEFLDGKRLAQDEELINSDPALFSCFYNLPCQGMSLAELHRLASSFALIIDFFPKTFHLLCAALPASPSRLFQRFLDYLAERDTIDAALTAQQCYRYFPDFAQALIETQALRDWPVLPQVLRYEKLSLQAVEAKRDEAPGDPEKPLRRARQALGYFSMDMYKLVADLKNGLTPREHLALPCAVVFTHDGNRLDAVQLNQFGADLLNLCDGEHTLEQIAAELSLSHGQHLQQEALAVHCRDAVEVFQHNGLLAAVASTPNQEVETCWN